jgi:hypothetical protein
MSQHLYGQAHPHMEPSTLRIFLSAEDMAWLRIRQFANWESTDKMIDLPTLVQAIIKEARLAEAMGEKAEASA